MITELRSGVLALAAGIAAAAAPAGASVTISTGATENVSCSAGLCAPTAADAVLNVGDLENLLASGNVEVTTTGSGVQAKDIVVKAALTWSNSSALALDADRSLFVEKPVAVNGNGGVAVNFSTANGDLYFEKKGNVTFADLSGSLTINGSAYTLENTIQGLAAAIADNPNGYYALAGSIDAKQNGTYTSYPIPTPFSGIFEGLGNEISRLRISGKGGAGLFSEFLQGSVVRDIAVVDVYVRSTFQVGGLAAVDELGQVLHCHVTGKITGTVTPESDGFVGGLIGLNAGGTIVASSSGAAVRGTDDAAGGLVGLNEPLTGLGGVISNSFATGPVSVQLREGKAGSSGGLVGWNEASISYSYATGTVTGGGGHLAGEGGLVGENGGTITQSYSTGAVSGQPYLGGLIGYDESASGSLSDTYWDTDTSGITNLSQGAGYPANDPGITGLTTAEFQSGLPDGFDPKVWSENSKINNGFPYLVSNVPD